MKFRLFGFPVEIQGFFWITALFLGMTEQDPKKLLTWVAIVLVSVLVHELGHAFAYRRFGVESAIVLHGMGGATYGRELVPISRGAHAIVSLAGPFAGFALAGVVFGVERLIPGGPPPHDVLAGWAILQLKWVNIGWGVLNLLPVLPYDGGHVLDSALGPTRAKTTALASMVIGIAIACAMLHYEQFWGFYIFGRGALVSYLRYRALDAIAKGFQTPEQTGGGPPTVEILALLKDAKAALDAEDFVRARVLAGDVIAKTSSREAARDAYEIIAWSFFLTENITDARAALDHATKLGPVDAALEGALLLATGELDGARKALEAARARGDDRKDVAGTLIRVLIAQGEIVRVGQIAVEISDVLSDEDVRKLAKITFDGQAFDWAARLYQVMFLRRRSADDAYEAARALACAGQLERAVEWIKKAVEAGFSDRARAWSDAALEALWTTERLGTVLPRE